MKNQLKPQLILKQEGENLQILRVSQLKAERTKQTMVLEGTKETGII